MRTPAVKKRPRTSELKVFPAPRNGWVKNMNLSQPNAKNPDGTAVSGAAVLDNFFPTAQGIRLMRGSELYATLGSGNLPVTSLFAYNVGTVQQMFGSTDEAIYDITTVSQPNNAVIAADEDTAILATDQDDMIGWGSTDGLDVMTGLTGGNWVVAQFATAGGTFLVGVNGADPSFTYDGTTFYPNYAGGVSRLNFDNETGAFTEGLVVTGGTSGATATILRVNAGNLWLVDITGGPFQDNEALTDTDTGAADADGTEVLISPGTGITFPSGEAFDTSDLSYDWAYKQRLFFIQKETLDAWYLPVDQIAGELKKLPLGGIFELGGSLLFGASWSLDSGNQGGLSEQCIFVTTEGEVAVYQGANPDSADDWSKVGVYRIGRPLGATAWIRDGGDLIIATSIGYVRLKEAIRRELAALGPTAVSYPIEEAWNTAVDRSSTPWHAVVWPSKQMAVIAVPTAAGDDPAMFVANVRTGAWARRTNWDGTCLLVFKERLFFGSTAGRVVEANVSGLDEGKPYTGICVPLFDDLGTPASLKITQLVRAVGLSPVNVSVGVSMQTDFLVDLPPAPAATLVPVGNEWGNAIWGSSTWGGQSAPLPRQQWESCTGTGYALSPAVQITSGSVVPLDYDLVRVEATYQAADVVT